MKFETQKEKENYEAYISVSEECRKAQSEVRHLKSQLKEADKIIKQLSENISIEIINLVKQTLAHKIKQEKPND